MNSFYVDDCLRSSATKEEAREILHGTTKVLQEGGFTLTKFIDNDMKLLENVPEEHRAKEVKDFKPNSAGRALGIKWNIMSDTFYFDVNYELQEPVTRRQLISAVSSMFDPLGLISPIILTGKLIFQEATRQKLSWMNHYLVICCKTGSPGYIHSTD